jgi:hypothetical protein
MLSGSFQSIAMAWPSVFPTFSTACVAGSRQIDLSAGSWFLFGSAVWITELKFGAAESLTGYLAEGLPFNSTKTTSKDLSPVFSGK